MKRRFKFTSTVSDYLKRFLRGEEAGQTDASVPLETEAEQPQSEEKTLDGREIARKGPAQPADTTPVETGEGLLCYADTNVGRVRSSNQDAVIRGEGLYGVADGMGGHKGGETASAGARDGLIELLKGKTPAIDALRSAVEEVNGRLFRQQMTDDRLTGMGTTLTVLWFSEHYVYIAQVGDSRAYRFRDGKMEQVTRDHSLVAELVRAGVLTPEQAAEHPMRNVITRAVGTEEMVDTDILVEERKAGDLWLVCSDGLYGMTTDEAMEKILQENTPDKCVPLLIEAALNGGGHDNVSVVVLHDKEGSR